MKTIAIIGYKREGLTKAKTKKIRREGNVPCVLYGGDKEVHFHSPGILFRDLLYTDEAHFVELNIEGELYSCILQDYQFHPVSENILHADFLMLQGQKPVKMNIPVRLQGFSPGVEKGGNLIHKRLNLAIRATPANMPDFITVDISELDFGKAIKVGEVKEDGFEILDPKIASVAVVETPRALIVETEEEVLEGEEGEEGEEIVEGAPAEEGSPESRAGEQPTEGGEQS